MYIMYIMYITYTLNDKNLALIYIQHLRKYVHLYVELERRRVCVSVCERSLNNILKQKTILMYRKF